MGKRIAVSIVTTGASFAAGATGMAAGSAIGTAIFPGVGTIIGTIAGAIIGGIASWYLSKGISKGADYCIDCSKEEEKLAKKKMYQNSLKILNVKNEDSLEEIDKNKKKLWVIYHPDK